MSKPYDGPYAGTTGVFHLTVAATGMVNLWDQPTYVADETAVTMRLTYAQTLDLIDARLNARLIRLRAQEKNRCD